MSTLDIVFIVVLLGVLGGVFIMIQRMSKMSETMTELKAAQQGDKSILALKEDFKSIHERLDRQTESVQKSIQSQLGESTKIVREVTERLTKLDESQRQVIDLKSSIQHLHETLSNPKRRGILGEYYLETLLKNIFAPGQFERQFDLGNDPDTGKKLIADAVIRVKDKLIPVDAKFSLENYNRFAEAATEEERKRYEKVFVNDLKLRIQETAKYIQPQKNTLDFAFMFIPHEAIYYDLLTNKIGLDTADNQNLIQRAASKYKVIIVSPTSFLAYLQTVLQGLHAMKIEETAQQIIKRVADLGRHMQKYEEYYRKLGSALDTAINQYNSGYKELGKIDKDVVKIADVEGKVEPVLLEKPNIE